MAKYFIGIGLPEKEERLIRFVKQQFPSARGSSTPPHITLTEPFYVDGESGLVNDLEKWSKNQKPFIINIEVVGSFKQPTYGTLFLEPTEKDDLKKLQANLTKEINYLPSKGNFVAHLTIANGVDFADMEALNKRLTDMGIKLKLRVDKVILYKMENGNRWIMVEEFDFDKEG